MSKRILTLFAHPAQRQSEVNLPLSRKLQQLDQLTLVDLYADYPRARIDVDREQQRLIDHDIVIFQFPLYWYSTPAILKEWQDLVLEYGFAYGHSGDKLKGKILWPVVSAGGKEDAYQHEGLNQYPLRELLRPLEQTAHLCQMHYLPPFVLFGARTAQEEGRVSRHIHDVAFLCEQLSRDELDLRKLAPYSLMNDYLHSLDHSDQGAQL